MLRQAENTAGWVGDLRDLPQNRLSAMRGVGRQVTKDILEFRARWSDSARPGLRP